MGRLTKRRRIFYPESDRTYGLYTQGKEWMLVENDKEYKGPYHKFSDGVVMTGAEPSKQSKYLIPYKDISEASVKATELYRSITTEKVDKYVMPRYYFPILRPVDKENGYIQRYFVQKKNNPIAATIIEIDKTQFDNVKMKNGTHINGKLYKKISLRWVILGTEDEIKSKNRETLSTYERRCPGIKQYLGVLTELSKFSPITSS